MGRDTLKTIESFSRRFTTPTNPKKHRQRGIHYRRLICEPLEDRRLLSLGLDDSAGADAVQLFGVSPALFVDNQGQWSDPSVRYAFQGSGANVLFTDTGPVFQVFRRDVAEQADGPDGVTHRADPLANLAEHEETATRSAQFSVTFDGGNLVEPAGGPTESQQYAWEGYVREVGDSSGGTQRIIAGVPAYLWHHGCGPTAAGMVVGYWDMHGYGGLIPFDSNTQTSQVDTAIASAEHYDDYSVPIDDHTPTILADKSELGGGHSPHNCLADWMHTSWSLDGNRYGWTYMSRVDDAVDSYCDWKGYAGFTATNETWGALTWNDFVSEINNNRPMVFLVDTDGNGATDHFIAAIGYDSTGNRYACYDTWDSSVHWYDFRQIAAGQPWGIYGATYISPPSDDAYEENDTLAAAYDLSSRHQTWLSTINGPGILADDADWYRIDVAPGYEHLIVDLRFTNAQGDIDIQVYDAGGGLVTGSYGTTDNEYIDCVMPASGTYYLKIYCTHVANQYDLWWDDQLRIAADTTVSVSDNRDLLIEDVVVGGKADSLTLSLDTAPTPDELIIHDPNAILGSDIPGAAGSGSHTLRVPMSAFGGPGFTRVIVNTLDGNDVLTLDFSRGNLIPLWGAVHYDGGANGPDGDRVRVIGTPAMAAEYLAFPSMDVDEGFSIDETGDRLASIELVGIERKEISSVQTVSVVTWNSPNALTLSADSVSGVRATTITGTATPEPIGPLTIYDVAELLLDRWDDTGAGPNEVLLTGDHVARGLKSITMNLGTGANRVEVAGVVDLGAEGHIQARGEALYLTLSGGSITAERVQLPMLSQLSGSGTINAVLVGVDRIEATGAMNLGTGAYGGFNFAGTLVLNNFTMTLSAADFARLGTLTTINGGVLDAANGIALGAGSTLQGAGTVHASVAAQVGSTIVATGSLALGDANVYDGFVSDGRLHVGAHSVTLRDRNEAALGSLTTLGSASTPGVLTIPNSAVVNFGKTVTGYGTLDTPNDAARPLINNGDMLGDSLSHPLTLPGYVKGVGNFDNVQFTGTYSPGLSATRQFVGSLRFAETCTLLIEIGGTQPGAQYDQLVASGTLDLGGALDVDLTGGYVPGAGAAFEIMTSAGGVFGTFNTELLPALPPDRFWHVTYSTHAVTLEVRGAPATVDIVDVTPDPRTAAVDRITIVFSEAITGFDLDDLTLARDGSRNLLTASQILTSSDNVTWELDNLSGLTRKAGAYVLTLTAAGSGITDLSDTPLEDDASDDWETDSTIAGRRLFYNNSKWDAHTGFLNGDPAANASDDNAIAPDKQALLPGGGKAAFKNYTSFSRGLNGIMVDVAGLPVATLAAADFAFTYGNDDTPDDWFAAADPTTIAVRAGAGAGGSDRVTLIWADNAIPNGNWLRVAVKANEHTGLAADDLFYFGLAIGETGNSLTEAKVNSSDVTLIRLNYSGFLTAAIDNVYDFNRDQKVNSADVTLCRNHYSGFTPLKLITPPAGMPQPEALGFLGAMGAKGSSSNLPRSTSPSREAVFDRCLSDWDARWYADLAWLYGLQDRRSKTNTTDSQNTPQALVDRLFATYGV